MLAHHAHKVVLIGMTLDTQGFNLIFAFGRLYISKEMAMICDYEAKLSHLPYYSYMFVL
jgi:hypothetical protein